MLVVKKAAVLKPRGAKRKRFFVKSRSDAMTTGLIAIFGGLGFTIGLFAVVYFAFRKMLQSSYSGALSSADPDEPDEKCVRCRFPLTD